MTTCDESAILDLLILFSYKSSERGSASQSGGTPNHLVVRFQDSPQDGGGPRYIEKQSYTSITKLTAKRTHRKLDFVEISNKV